MVKDVITRASQRGAKSRAWGHDADRGGGAAPKWVVVAVAGAVTVSLAAGCVSGSADQVTEPVDVGMTDKIMPYYSDGELTLYQVQIPVPLPVRKMTSADVKAVGPAPPNTPYPRGVFLRAEDESVEVRFTISNIDDAGHDVWLLIDPWNEFVRWRPGVTIIDDETTLPNYGYDMQFTVPGKQRVEGTITADDIHEIAIKLAAVEKLLASPQAQSPTLAGDNFNANQIANNIFNPQNRSNSVPSDLLYTPWIPAVVAGITGFDLGLRTAEAANVAVEITIEVQDLRGDRFVPQDDKADPQIGVPQQVLSPPGARF
jgi:hypothetical protein